MDGVENPNLILLKVPVKVTLFAPDGKESELEVTSLTFRENPVGADYLAIEGESGKLSMMSALAAKLTGQPRKVIDKLDGNSGDWARVMNRTADFLNPILEIAAFL
jgi:hypothetical protein